MSTVESELQTFSRSRKISSIGPDLPTMFSNLYRSDSSDESV